MMDLQSTSREMMEWAIQRLQPKKDVLLLAVCKAMDENDVVGWPFASYVW